MSGHSKKPTRFFMRYVIDTSGSMGPNTWNPYSKSTDFSRGMLAEMCQPIIETINETVNDKGLGYDTIDLSVYTFSNTSSIIGNVVFNNTEDSQDTITQKLSSIEEKLLAVKCSGNTALYDTINEVVQDTETMIRRSLNSEKLSNEDVMIVIVTDGEDTASYANAADTNKLTQKKEKDGWNIILLGVGELHDNKTHWKGVHSSVGVKASRAVSAPLPQIPGLMRSVSAAVRESRGSSNGGKMSINLEPQGKKPDTLTSGLPVSARVTSICDTAGVNSMSETNGKRYETELNKNWRFQRPHEIKIPDIPTLQVPDTIRRSSAVVSEPTPTMPMLLRRRN